MPMGGSWMRRMGWCAAVLLGVLATAAPVRAGWVIDEMMKQNQPKAAPPKPKAEDCVPDKVDIKSTGKHATVAGYDANGYQVFANGKPDSEVYIAPAITAVRELDPQKLEKMVAEML